MQRLPSLFPPQMTTTTPASKQKHVSSILYTAPDQSVVVVDIPRSIEEAQVLAGHPLRTRRLLSSEAPLAPRLLPEPKGWGDAVTTTTTAAISVSPSAAIAELMTLETVSAALKNARSGYKGDVWCLPRMTASTAKAVKHERSKANVSEPADETNSGRRAAGRCQQGRTSIETPISPSFKSAIHIPHGSHQIVGAIQETREEFTKGAPLFDLILLDPPWPSRSVKRKRKTASYTTVSSMSEARTLLASIPVAAKLNGDHGLVAVWITNKPAVHDLLVAPGTGVFAQWGVELVGEYVWLKITDAGEPVFDLGSQWRRPWERLLLARPVQRPGSDSSGDGSSSRGDAAPGRRRAIPAKVILAVPDLHSRKPNLRRVLRDLLPPDYLGLEVFARNLTAGWWSWGDEALLFQQPEHWVEIEERPDILTSAAAADDAEAGANGQLLDNPKIDKHGDKHTCQ